MQVQPGLQEMGAYASLRHATRCAHQKAVRQHRLDHQAPASIGDVQRSCRVGLRVALARSGVQQVAQQPGARTIQREQRQALSPSPHPLATTLRCTCGAAPWRKASSSITCCTSQRSAVSFAGQRCVVASPHGQRVAQVLQLLRLRCWKRARTQQSGALHARKRK